MVNLYELLDIPENADRLTIERAIRLARSQGNVEERYLQLASNYLLHDKRRAQYNQKMGIKARTREKNRLSVGTDWRYVGGGVALVLSLFIPLGYVMLGQQKAAEQLYQNPNSEYQKAQESMQKAWSNHPAQPDELQHKAIERQLNEAAEAHQKKLEQMQ
ncbi:MULTISPECIES: hypothetical protein [Vitreoscilla]|uniref:J domain-containing protein n=1 Tax=Vitreoscilla stercoraria TaxID=61 RepID=A0ABY4E8S1_VITST|nr:MULTISPECIES: hypothetical protein [Vitreoscilla]AUZ04460.2 hypothetical protein ADP71_06940 [Vitreoscilla sp. C1]UOO91829.1 hypothetical protein LVJ81_09320 [Vitreoscilla stercoraria]